MANNELSGPCLAIYLSKWIMSKKRKYTYRFVFLPETIGSITYIEKNYKILKEKVISGLNVTCVGDNNNYSFLPSRKENGILDKIIQAILIKKKIKFKKYSWIYRGSDERQYCWPNTDLSISSLMLGTSKLSSSSANWKSKVPDPLFKLKSSITFLISAAN